MLKWHDFDFPTPEPQKVAFKKDGDKTLTARYQKSWIFQEDKQRKQNNMTC